MFGLLSLYCAQCCWSGDAGRRTDAQWLLDAAATWRVLDHVTLFVRGENLFLQAPVVSRRPWGARPGRPFQAQVGLRFDL
jgi:Fe(3+) dicitrate transport protein